MAPAFPDFTKLSLGDATSKADMDAWKKLAGAGANAVWDTPEGLPVKQVYTGADTKGLDFLDDFPGIAPRHRPENGRLVPYATISKIGGHAIPH